MALDREFARAGGVLLLARGGRRARHRTGELDFLASTRPIRDADWHVAPAPADLTDRRVEITGPPRAQDDHQRAELRRQGVDGRLRGRHLAHLGQRRRRPAQPADALDGTISLAPDGQEYKVGDDLATIMVRPRGWHLPESHVGSTAGRCPRGCSTSACTSTAAERQLERGSGPYFYLPKLESHLEARLWNDVFVFAQDLLGIPRGTIRATVLIETITAAFEMEEILYELREHSAGLNAGRWDYIFSMIKKFRTGRFVLPGTRAGHDDGAVHARVHRTAGAGPATGAARTRSAAWPRSSRAGPVAAKRALDQVRQDKRREVGDGFDGSWVAHPGLVGTCREVFDQCSASAAPDRAAARRRPDADVAGGRGGGASAASSCSGGYGRPGSIAAIRTGRLPGDHIAAGAADVDAR